MVNQDILKSDNLKNHVSRVHVVEGSFTADDGKVINYTHLYVSFLIRGKKFDVKAKLSEKDKLLLSMSDDLDGSNSFVDDGEGA